MRQFYHFDHFGGVASNDAAWRDVLSHYTSRRYDRAVSDRDTLLYDRPRADKHVVADQHRAAYGWPIRCCEAAAFWWMIMKIGIENHCVGAEKATFADPYFNCCAYRSPAKPAIVAYDDLGTWCEAAQNDRMCHPKRRAAAAACQNHMMPDFHSAAIYALDDRLAEA